MMSKSRRRSEGRGQSPQPPRRGGAHSRAKVSKYSCKEKNPPPSPTSKGGHWPLGAANEGENRRRKPQVEKVKIRLNQSLKNKVVMQWYWCCPLQTEECP